MKKGISIFLVMLLICCFCGSAFAEGEVNGTITVKNAAAGQTYTLYKILDLESYDANAGAYAYKFSSEWVDFYDYTSDGEKASDYLKKDAQGYVTWADAEKNAETFAKLAMAYAEGKNVMETKKAVASSATLTFTDLELGYYLVDTSLGSLCALDTTAPNADIEEKNIAPTISKTVKENSTGEFGDANDAENGQIVEFNTVVTAQKGADRYVVHDIMSDGLTLNEDSITVKGLEKGTDYTVEANAACKDKEGKDTVCTFHIEFKQSYLDTITEETQISIDYTATVKMNGAGQGNQPNHAVLTYGNDARTEQGQTTTYTWEIQIFKYTEQDTPLANATFELYKKADNDTKLIKFHQGTDNAYVVCGEADCKEAACITSATTDANGKITISGLDAGDYSLKEAVAPAGYNILGEEIGFTIASDLEDGSMTVTLAGETEAISGNTIKVLNNKGASLPSTGGMGTKILYAVGGVLVLVAVVLLITKRRISTK